MTGGAPRLRQLWAGGLASARAAVATVKALSWDWPSTKRRLRTLAIGVWLGWGALVMGLVLGGVLLVDAGLSRAVTARWLAIAVGALFSRWWVVAWLPALALLVARTKVLPPWSTACIAALAGELAVSTLQFAQGGLAGLYGGIGLLAWRVVTFVAGVVLTAAAIRAGTRRAQAAKERAAAAAQANRREYERMLEDAGRDR